MNSDKSLNRQIAESLRLFEGHPSFAVTPSQEVPHWQTYAMHSGQWEIEHADTLDELPAAICRLWLKVRAK